MYLISAGRFAWHACKQIKYLLFFSKCFILNVGILKWYVTLGHKSSHNSTGIFVAIANNTL